MKGQTMFDDLPTFLHKTDQSSAKPSNGRPLTIQDFEPRIQLQSSPPPAPWDVWLARHHRKIIVAWVVAMVSYLVIIQLR